jgi:hypothetical protein
MSKFYNPTTAAKELGVPPVTVRLYARTYLDPEKYKVGRTWIFGEEELEMLREKGLGTRGPGNPDFGKKEETDAD